MQVLLYQAQRAEVRQDGRSHLRHPEEEPLPRSGKTKKARIQETESATVGAWCLSDTGGSGNPSHANKGHKQQRDFSQGFACAFSLDSCKFLQ